MKALKQALFCVSELNSYGYVLYQLVRQQLILRYRRTVLGYLWTLLNPVLMMTVTAVVFSGLFSTDLKTFAIFLFAGMIPWNFFNALVTQSSLAFVSNEGLMKKIYLPKAIFPLAVSLSVLIDSFLSFGFLLLILLGLGGGLSFSLLSIPLSYLLLFFFSLGISFFVSIATVFFRDLQYVVGIGLQALFFLTPVLYKNNALVGKVGFIVKLNPIGLYIDLFRFPLVYGIFPSVTTFCMALLVTFVIFSVGLLFFLSQQDKIVFRL